VPALASLGVGGNVPTASHASVSERGARRDRTVRDRRSRMQPADTVGRRRRSDL